MRARSCRERLKFPEYHYAGWQAFRRTWFRRLWAKGGAAKQGRATASSEELARLAPFLVILAVVGLISSICAAWQLSAVLPIWQAVLVGLAAGGALVWCFTAGGDTDFFDLLIASVAMLFLV